MKTAVARLQPRSPPPRKPIGLALQGGGSWGAYTWGVLDSLLANSGLIVFGLAGLVLVGGLGLVLVLRRR